MANTKAISTKLEDRTLWYDGDSTIPESDLIDLITKGVSVSGLFVDEMSNNIKQYNAYVKGTDKIRVKSEVVVDTIEWVMPEAFKRLDPMQHIIRIADRAIDGDDRQGRLDRVVEELVLYDEMGLMEILKVLIYIINTLQTNNVVWGVGRGSSVSSYVLYLIGVHDVDSFLYGLDIRDFLHD